MPCRAGKSSLFRQVVKKKRIKQIFGGPKFLMEVAKESSLLSVVHT